MGTDAPSKFSTDEVVLDQLARQIREAVKAARDAQRNALHSALDAGDALNQAQGRLSTSGQSWLKSNCLLSVRTAQLYQQLADHRAEIEAEIDRIGDLSLRAARRLIMKPGEKSSPKKARFDAFLWWKSAPHEERKRLLAAIGLIDLVAALPPDMRIELERRSKRDTSESEEERATKILHTALSHLALSQSVAAINALRAMARIHADFHSLTVHVLTAKTRRAA